MSTLVENLNKIEIYFPTLFEEKIGYKSKSASLEYTIFYAVWEYKMTQVFSYIVSIVPSPLI